MRILLIGGGLFNLTLARLLRDDRHEVNIIEKSNFLGGMCADYFDKKAQCYVNKFGAHIFHFDNKSKKALQFLKKYADLMEYDHKVLCIGNGNFTYFPINNTYKSLFSLINDHSIFDEFIESYSKKVWGNDWNSIKKNIEKRFKAKNSFNNDFFEGEKTFLLEKGFSNLFNKLSKGINITYNLEVHIKMLLRFIKQFDKVVVSAPIDRFYNYKFGKLDWKGLQFDFHYLKSDNDILPTPVVNMNTHKDVVRIVEYNQLGTPLNSHTSKNKVICIERSSFINKCYPVLNDINNALYKKYIDYNNVNFKDISFVGRLGNYKYYDMDETIQNAINWYSNFKK